MKGQILNVIQFQRLRCKIVCIEPKIKSIQGDLFTNYWSMQFYSSSGVPVRSAGILLVLIYM